MTGIETEETGSPRRLVDIPRPNSEGVVLDLDDAAVINRELVLISMRAKGRYEGMSGGEGLQNNIVIICKRDKLVFLSGSDEDKLNPHAVKFREGFKGVNMRIRPTWQGRSGPTRIYVEDDMRFECEILDPDLGEIGIDVTSTSEIVVEYAEAHQDFRRILAEIERTT